MFTVYCTDTFDGTSWAEKFKTKEEALAYADKQAGEMLVCYVDDPQGRKIHRAGKF
jgi:hypothetical protein